MTKSVPKTEVKGYLVLNSKKIDRVSIRPPSLNFGEVACEINITVPSAIFNRPILSASVQFDGPVTHTLSSEVIETVDKLLTEHGFKVAIELINEPEEPMILKG